MFLRNLHVTKNRLSFAGSQTLLASENEFNSTGSFNFTGTVGDERRLVRIRKVFYPAASEDGHRNIEKLSSSKLCPGLFSQYLILKHLNHCPLQRHFTSLFHCSWSMLCLLRFLVFRISGILNRKRTRIHLQVTSPDR